MRSNHIVEFDELMSQLEINSEFLNKFNLDLNGFGFGDIIDLVEQNCDSFVSDELLLEIGGSREAGEINENQLHERIKLKLDNISTFWNIKDVNEILERKENEDGELDWRVEAEMKADDSQLKMENDKMRNKLLKRKLLLFNLFHLI